jgi:hypothetical protein
MHAENGLQTGQGEGKILEGVVGVVVADNRSWPDHRNALSVYWLVRIGACWRLHGLVFGPEKSPLRADGEAASKYRASG